MKNIYGAAQAATLFAGMLAAAAIFAGCSKDGGGGGAPPNPYAAGFYGANGCAGCGAGNSSLGTAIGRINDGVVELELQFYSAQQSYMPAGASYISQASYTGQVGASGFLNVLQTFSQTCPVLPGRYQIQTSRPGQLSGNSVLGLIMQGSGPTQIAVSVANAYLQQAIPAAVSRADGATFSNLIKGRVQIMPQSQYGCQALDLDNQPEPYYEQISG